MSPDIRPGAIVLAYVASIYPPKDKFGLVADIDVGRDSIVLFLIHSELPKLIESVPALAKGVTKILRREHQFLDYDSWVRFGEPHACSHSALLQQIRDGERRFFGYASVSLIEQLLSLIPACDELPRKKQVRYCNALATDERIGSRDGNEERTSA